MISSQRNIDLLCQLVNDTKEYGELRLERLQVDSADKASSLIASLIVGVVGIVFLAIIVVLLSVGLALLVAPHVGGTAMAMIYLAGIYLAIILLLWVFKGALITRPLNRALRASILTKPTSETLDADIAKKEKNMKSTLTALRDQPASLFESAVGPVGTTLFGVEKTVNAIDGVLLGYRLYQKFFGKKGASAKKTTKKRGLFGLF